MKYLLPILFLLISSTAFSQNYNDKQNIKVITTQDAAYPSGDQKLYEHIFYNIKYNDDHRANKVQGQVTLSFSVEKDGSLSNLQILQGVDNNLDKQLIAIFKPLKFSPEYQNGEKTKSTMVMNIPLAAY